MRYFGFNKPSFSMRRFGFAFSRFTPAELFANGKQGIWLDPSELTTMFQDVQGSIPVTKDGDPVALIKDKSGNNNHATQPTASARPIYRTDGKLHWLELDGVDDMFLLSKPIDMNKGTMAIACEATSKRTQTIISGSSAGYLAIHSSDYWVKHSKENAFESSGVLHQGRQSVVARIDDNTVSYVSSDGQSGVATSVFSGLHSTRLVFGFNTTGSLTFKGRVYGFIMLTNNVSDETSREILTYLDKVSGISL